MYKSSNWDLLIKSYDLITVLKDLCIKPIRWRYRLRKISIPVLLEEIEDEVGRIRPLSLSPPTIGYLVRRRISLTVRWRRTRCLFNSMLLSYLLARAKQTVTLHIGCNIKDDNTLNGHCWISGPDLKMNQKYMPSAGKDEIHCKTFYPRNYDDSVSSKDCDTFSGKPRQHISRSFHREHPNEQNDSVLYKFYSRLSCTRCTFFTRKSE